MKKELLTEIIRLQQMMGVDKKILLEGNLFSVTNEAFLDLVDTYFKKLVPKEIVGTADEILVAGETITKRAYRNILYAIDNPDYINLLDNVEKSIFGKILSKNSEIVNYTYKNVLQEVVDALGISEKEVIQRIIDKMSGGKTLDEVLTEMSPNDDLANSILRKKVLEKIRQIETGTFTEDIKIKIGKWVDPTTGKLWSAPEVKEMDQSLKGWANKRRDTLRNIFGVYEGWWANFIRKWWSSFRVTWEKQQIHAIESAKRYIQETYRLQKEGKAGEAAVMAKRALSHIILIKQEPGDNVNEIIKAFITENPNLSQEVKDLFLKSKTSNWGNQTVQEFIGNISKDAQQNMNEPIKRALKAYAEMFPFIKTATSKLDANVIKNTIYVPAVRIFNFITWKDPRFAIEVVTSMAQRGIKKELRAKLISYLVMNYLVVPWLLAWFDTWRKNIALSVRYAALVIQLKTICKLPNQTEEQQKECDEAQKEIDSIQFETGEDYFKNYLANLPIDFGKILGDAAWNEAHPWKSAFFFTWWDDLLFKIYDAVQGSPVPFVGPPQMDAILKAIKEGQTFTENELREMGIDPNGDIEKQLEQLYKDNKEEYNEAVKQVKSNIEKVEQKVDSVVTPQPAPSPPTPTEEEFKKFIKNKFDHFVQFTETGYDTDGNFYFWDKTKNTFYKAGQMEQ